MKKLLFYSIFLLLAGWSLQSCEVSPGDDEDGGDPSNLGVYVVMEGNMSDNNGMLCYIDGEGKLFTAKNADGSETTDLYGAANGGAKVGNVLQDIYLYHGKIYMLTQNGPDRGGDGYMVICDAKTMKQERVFGNESALADPGIWPQHLVVVDEETVFVRYSTSDNETHAGIRIFNPKTDELSGDIPGTAGVFMTEGSMKMRMVYHDGKIFAPCGFDLVVLDARQRGKEIARVKFDSQIKGIVLGLDNNIYMTIAGQYEGKTTVPDVTTDPSQMEIKYLTRSRIVGVNSSTYEQISEKKMPSGVNFPVHSAAPGIGMCASFTEDAVFFWDGPFKAFKIWRYEYKTGKLAKIIDLTASLENMGWTIYGYIGVGQDNKLYVGTSDYLRTRVLTFDPVTGERLPDSYDIDSGSPSGIDFPIRFPER